MQYEMVGLKKNDELESNWKEMVIVHLRYYTDICLERMTKITRNPSQDGWCLARDLNHADSKYKSMVLSLD
jgi:hypothetical protein